LAIGVAGYRVFGDGNPQDPNAVQGWSPGWDVGQKPRHKLNCNIKFMLLKIRFLTCIALFLNGEKSGRVWHRLLMTVYIRVSK